MSDILKSDKNPKLEIDIKNTSWLNCCLWAIKEFEKGKIWHYRDFIQYSIYYTREVFEKIFKNSEKYNESFILDENNLNFFKKMLEIKMFYNYFLKNIDIF